MSQKINPLGFKLGTLQLWTFSFSSYGKNFKSYKKYFNFAKFTFNYIKRFLNKYFLFLNTVDVYFLNKKLFIFISFFNFKNNKIFFETNIIKNFISSWWNIEVKLNFHKNLYLTNSSFLIGNYLTYSIEEKKVLPKKVLQDILKILKNHSKNQKIVYTSNGIKKINFKGFKLQLTGCFDNSRSQMSKSLCHNFGSVPLTKLNGYTEYTKCAFFTKLGVCGLKIWLFYEFKDL